MDEVDLQFSAHLSRVSVFFLFYFLSGENSKDISSNSTEFTRSICTTKFTRLFSHILLEICPGMMKLFEIEIT